jgi:hypothetical protein
MALGGFVLCLGHNASERIVNRSKGPLYTPRTSSLNHYGLKSKLIHIKPGTHSQFYNTGKIKYSTG